MLFCSHAWDWTVTYGQISNKNRSLDELETFSANKLKNLTFKFNFCELFAVFSCQCDN